MAKPSTGNRNGKFRSQRPQNVRSNKNPKIKSDMKRKLYSSRVQDARQKIIQKKRKTVVDARDILSKMAKSHDARNKINYIRTGKSPRPSTSGHVKVIGSNILRRTDHNGKISLITNKRKQKTDINTTIQKQLGLIPNFRSPQRRPAVKKNVAVNISKSPLRIRKTILNDMDYPREYSPGADSRRFYDSALYKWTRPELRSHPAELRSHPASEMINSLETTRQVMRETLREELSNGWPTYASHRYTPNSRLFRPSRMQPTEYINLDDDEEMPLEPRRPSIQLHGTSRVSNVHSRLDGLTAPPESHGIFSQSKTKVVVPAGHRIVVSNLKPSVTQDDIKELFEDIGQLLAAKLVRPGVAEVIYKNLKDAQKAVDTYHNRQLDAQPMKCLLVNKRPLHQPTALPITKSEPIVSARKVPAVPPCPPSNKLIPDINTIHKVLFHRK